MQDIEFENQRQRIKLIPQPGEISAAQLRSDYGKIEVRPRLACPLGAGPENQHFLNLQIAGKSLREIGIEPGSKSKAQRFVVHTAAFAAKPRKQGSPLTRM